MNKLMWISDVKQAPPDSKTIYEKYAWKGEEEPTPDTIGRIVFKREDGYRDFCQTPYCVFLGINSLEFPKFDCVVQSLKKNNRGEWGGYRSVPSTISYFVNRNNYAGKEDIAGIIRVKGAIQTASILLETDYMSGTDLDLVSCSLYYYAVTSNGLTSIINDVEESCKKYNTATDLSEISHFYLDNIEREVVLLIAKPEDIFDY